MFNRRTQLIRIAIVALFTITTVTLFQITVNHYHKSKQDTPMQFFYSEHEACRAHLDRYSQFHRSALNGHLKDVSYIVYTCTSNGCAGLGDRLIGIITAFYVALLTQRVFLIDSSHPVDLDQVLSPNKIDWRFNRVNEIIGLPTGLSRMRDFNVEQRKVFLNEDFTSTYIISQMQRVQINQRLYILMHQNPHFAKRRQELGLDQLSSFQLFGCLFHYLFAATQLYRLLPSYNQLFYNPINHKRIPMIGMHIRTGSGVGENDRISKEDITKFLECGTKMLLEHPFSKILIMSDSKR